MNEQNEDKQQENTQPRGSALNELLSWWGAKCFLHQWDKWEQYKVQGVQYAGILAPKSVQGIPHRYEDTRQRRICKRCGKMQDEIIVCN